MARVALFVCLVACALAATSPEGGNRVLVLLDSLDQKQTHSLFFDNLADRGYDLAFALASDEELALNEFGEYLYDQLIVFSPAANDFGGTVSVHSILDFIDAGRNVLIAASPDIGEAVRDIADKCGIGFDAKDGFVIDHFNFDDSDSGEHTLIVADNFVDSKVILGKDEIDPVLFRGIGHAILEDDKDRLLTEILTGSASSYTHDPTEAVTDFPLAVGTSNLLVSALQARNGARVVFSGSIDLFSNEFFTSSVESASGEKAENSGNAEFAEELTSWAFHERGILRFRNVDFHKEGETEKPEFLRVEDLVDFKVVIEEWNGKEWAAYKANDVQLEFVMLDPYVRQTMKHDNKGTFSAHFKTPDRYGVFQFKISYHRLGYTGILYHEQVPVRPFRHDEFERFIVQAYPYYASSLSMLVGFFLFSVAFVHYRPAH